MHSQQAVCYTINKFICIALSCLTICLTISVQCGVVRSVDCKTHLYDNYNGGLLIVYITENWSWTQLLQKVLYILSEEHSMMSPLVEESFGM